VRHVFVTQDYPPVGGGMARRHVELCRRIGPGATVVSTVASDVPSRASAFDEREQYQIVRQPFTMRGAKTFPNAVRWAASVAAQVGAGDVLHCGNVRPAGYPVWWAHRRRGVPYVVYVYGGDVLRERRKAARNVLKRWVARRIFSDAAGVVAISTYSADLVRDVMRQIGVRRPPPVAAIDLGTDPKFFSPTRDSGIMRRRWGIGGDPLLLTVARLVPHKGQDVALRAVARLVASHPTVRYAVVGDGPDSSRLRALAAQLGIADRVVFAGAMTDADVADAYATATVYVGLSRLDQEIDVEGFGIAFVEAAASGVPAVAGDSGGVRSAVRDGETGLVVPPMDVDAVAQAMRTLLDDAGRRHAMGCAGRRAVESHYNWDRVARETLAFVARVTGTAPADGGV
jgi:phosphatidyl-myo-inositol dimannoside synthase